jgi:hypothetical protein
MTTFAQGGRARLNKKTVIMPKRRTGVLSALGVEQDGCPQQAHRGNHIPNDDFPAGHLSRYSPSVYQQFQPHFR